MYHHKYTITGTSTHVNFSGTQSKTCCNQVHLLLHVIFILWPLCFLIFFCICLLSGWTSIQVHSSTYNFIHVGLPNITSTQNKNTNAVLLVFLRRCLGKGFFRCDWLLWLCFGTGLHHHHLGLGWSDADLRSRMCLWRRMRLWRGLWSWARPWSWRYWSKARHLGRWWWRWWGRRSTNLMPMVSVRTRHKGQLRF